MVHEYPLFNVTEFVHPSFGHAARRTVASYEHELAERRDTEFRLRGALAREEALLRQKDELLNHRKILNQEADHRLMNGLQMVESLLSLQSRSETDPRAAVHLSSAANRVATIARIHSRLHSLDGQETVAFKRFIDELCHDYSAMLIAEDRRNHGMVVEGVEARLPAARHPAQPDHHRADHQRRQARAGRHHGPARGDRRGRPCPVGVQRRPALATGLRPAAGEGLGMKIVLALVEQIGGTLQIGPCAQCQGTRFAVAFI